MKHIKNILVVVHGQDDGEIVLDKAIALAKGCGAQLHVCKVIYEGYVDLSVHDVTDSQELKNFVVGTQESFLDDLIDPVCTGDITISSMVLWNPCNFEGILEARDRCKADLIIKSTQLPESELLRTPQDFHLLRHTSVPVMLVKPARWRANPVVVAAIDVENKQQQALNERIVKSAAAIKQYLTGELQLIDAFPSVEHWLGPVTLVIDFDQVRKKVSGEIRSRLAKLSAENHSHVDTFHAEEGAPYEAITALVKATEAEILVMGTVQRTGVKGLFIGNTSEMIVHHVNCDVLVLI